MKYAIQSLIAGLLVVGLQGCNPTETNIPTKKPSHLPIPAPSPKTIIHP